MQEKEIIDNIASEPIQSADAAVTAGEIVLDSQTFGAASEVTGNAAPVSEAAANAVSETVSEGAANAVTEAVSDAAGNTATPGVKQEDIDKDPVKAEPAKAELHKEEPDKAEPSKEEPVHNEAVERAISEFVRARDRAHQYADSCKKNAERLAELSKQLEKTAFTKSEKKEAASKKSEAAKAEKAAKDAEKKAIKSDEILEKETRKAEKQYGVSTGKKADKKEDKKKTEQKDKKAEKVKEEKVKETKADKKAEKVNEAKADKKADKKEDKKADKAKDAKTADNVKKSTNSAKSGNPKKSSDTQDGKKRKKLPRTYMKLHTALALSLNNLMTKKGRTFLTAFAGSIGIIGISLILSLSTGVQAYIDSVEEDTLSSYPVAIEQSTVDILSVMSNLRKEQENIEQHEEGRIYTNEIMTTMMKMMIEEASTNNLKDFKAFIEKNNDKFKSLSTDISYLYSTNLNLYRSDIENGIYQVCPSQVFSSIGMRGMGGSSRLMNTEVFQRLINNDDLLKQQYSVVTGRFPERFDEVVLIVSNNYDAVDYTFYTIGILDKNELGEVFKKLYAGEEAELPSTRSYTYDEILGVSFKLLLNSDYFEKQEDGTWVDKSDDEVYMTNKLANAHEVKIVGILKSESNAAMSNLSGIIGYRTDLMDYLINEVNKSEVVTAQKANSDTDIFTGIKFDTGEEEQEALTMDMLKAYISSLPADQQASYAQSIEQMRGYGMDDNRILETFASVMAKQTTDATYEGNLKKLGVSDLAEPTTINIYPKDFESKDSIMALVDEYNASLPEDEKIKVSDYLGLILDSVTTIINAISYILIAFVSISLVVSSIMIGIITYISVLERTKEIGILRAIGASKKDISRVFNAETLIVGFSAGVLGIVIAELMLIPINAIIYKLTDIKGLAVMPPVAAGILVLISMLLTFIAGLFPSRIAAKKDPVVALRTE
ncbi:MAG: FtsX-like permease family protein [Lachnospiraceae bacterium]|nr:FtsX-like permease family protein [Lachnospiraceae bacterium]